MGRRGKNTLKGGPGLASDRSGKVSLKLWPPSPRRLSLPPALQTWGSNCTRFKLVSWGAGPPRQREARRQGDSVSKRRGTICFLGIAKYFPGCVTWQDSYLMLGLRSKTGDDTDEIQDVLRVLSAGGLSVSVSPARTLRSDTPDPRAPKRGSCSSLLFEGAHETILQLKSCRS